MTYERIININVNRFGFSQSLPRLDFTFNRLGNTTNDGIDESSVRNRTDKTAETITFVLPKVLVHIEPPDPRSHRERLWDNRYLIFFLLLACQSGAHVPHHHKLFHHQPLLRKTYIRHLVLHHKLLSLSITTVIIITVVVSKYPFATCPHEREHEPPTLSEYPEVVFGRDGNCLEDETTVFPSRLQLAVGRREGRREGPRRRALVLDDLDIGVQIEFVVILSLRLGSVFKVELVFGGGEITVGASLGAEALGADLETALGHAALDEAGVDVRGSLREGRGFALVGENRAPRTIRLLSGGSVVASLDRSPDLVLVWSPIELLLFLSRRGRGV
ncbi:DNA-binding protein HU-beta [Striga asiatica]|uniref:DNA-binding protein HU-beta n=1 Tax=Striga asiatica TaxID=4170 RepID=A0A5A7PUL9_STRAF|nr:DNA-binding protein HU-beta [Striga asiatica]